MSENGFKQQMAKTGCKVVGLLRCKNEYVQKTTGRVFHSVDLDIQGTKLPVNVKLNENFNRAALPEDGELVSLVLGFRPGFGGKGYDVEAIS